MKKYVCAVLLLILILLPCIFFGDQATSDQTGISMIASVNRQFEDYSQGRNLSTNPDPSKQWAISTIMANQAWGIAAGRPDIYIAVLDTGIDEKHEDLAGQVINRANFTSSPTTNDIYGHGTHVAGIIAALKNNLGVTGLAYGCRLLNVKVADDSGWCDNSSIAKGIMWSVDHGAKVINISLYIFKPSPDLDEAMNYAWNKGVVVVAPSGNGVGNKIIYPGYYSNCIAVAGTDINDTIPAWSGSGQWVHIAAPGTDIISTMPHNDYDFKSGTSMASAYVSGLAGLLFSVIPNTERSARYNERIHLAIENSSDLTNMSAIGRINAFRAINMIVARKAD